MRRSELLGLTLGDVDLESRTMRVVGGKGNKDRLVPLTQIVPFGFRTRWHAASHARLNS